MPEEVPQARILNMDNVRLLTWFIDAPKIKVGPFIRRDAVAFIKPEPETRTIVINSGTIAEMDIQELQKVVRSHVVCYACGRVHLTQDKKKGTVVEYCK